jgi:predicted RNase H-like nuclease (RuvC/YqgF family)
LHVHKTEESQNAGPSDELSSTPRNQLVIQLSQQVTTLDVENQELKQELEAMKQLLQKFEMKERRVKTKSRTKCNTSVCVNMASLHLNSSSKVELHG